MIEYSNDDFSCLRADAVVIEVNCIGELTCPFTQDYWRFAPDIQAQYQQLFEGGKIEPGFPQFYHREHRSPPYAIFMPTRVHPQGPARVAYLQQGINELFERSIQLGIKSLAVPRPFIAGESESDIVRLDVLSAFARMPDMKLVLWSPRLSHSARKQISIFTDGGAAPNPGVGGYGVVLRFGETQKELSAAFSLTSNIRMELMAAIVGLETLKQPCRVRLHSDSRYLIDAVNSGWLFRWAAKNWVPNKLKNRDLWQRFLTVYMKHEVEMVWVKGHAGIEGNERCDKLATAAIRSGNFCIDEGYDAQPKQKKPNKTPTAQPAPRPAKQTLVNSPEPEPKTSQPRQEVEITGTKAKKVGDLCRYCQLPVVRRETKKHKPDAAYWYQWYLYCEQCKRIYLVEEAKTMRQD